LHSFVCIQLREITGGVGSLATIDNLRRTLLKEHGLELGAVSGVDAYRVKEFPQYVHCTVDACPLVLILVQGNYEKVHAGSQHIDSQPRPAMHRES